MNLQQTVTTSDLAGKLLKEFFKINPLEKVRHLITHFRIIPVISTNALNGTMDVTFQPGVNGIILLEDVFILLEKAYSVEERLIVILDEFQEIRELAPNLDKQLRAIMQTQQHINYILLGSQESLMTEIFENKKSPYYHFGELMRLGKLPREDFHKYLSERLSDCFPNDHGHLADLILDYTDCHPYYSQQLAANIWQIGVLQPDVHDPFNTAIAHIVTTHSHDYERLWINLNQTNKWIMKTLALNKPLQTGEHRTSTIYSALKRLQKNGYVIYSDRYEIEDPFFKEWIIANN